jgi:hypothetical protein
MMVLSKEPFSGRLKGPLKKDFNPCQDFQEGSVRRDTTKLVKLVSALSVLSFSSNLLVLKHFDKYYSRDVLDLPIVPKINSANL